MTGQDKTGHLVHERLPSELTIQIVAVLTVYRWHFMVTYGSPTSGGFRHISGHIQDQIGILMH